MIFSISMYILLKATIYKWCSYGSETIVFIEACADIRKAIR